MKEHEGNIGKPQECNPFSSVRRDMRRLKFAIKDINDRRSRKELDWWQHNNAIVSAVDDFIESLHSEINPDEFWEQPGLGPDPYNEPGRKWSVSWEKRTHLKLERRLLEKRKKQR